MATAQKPIVQKITDPVQIARLEGAAKKGDMEKFVEITLNSKSIEVVRHALDIAADMRNFEAFKKIALGQQELHGTTGHAMQVLLESGNYDAAAEICAGIGRRELAYFAVKMLVTARWENERKTEYEFENAKVSALKEYAAVVVAELDVEEQGRIAAELKADYAKAGPKRSFRRRPGGWRIDFTGLNNAHKSLKEAEQASA